MRTSLEDIKSTEEFHFRKGNTGDRLLFEARMLISPMLRFNAAIQTRLYEFIRFYGRKKMKGELNDIHNQLMSSPENRVFKSSIDNIFN